MKIKIGVPNYSGDIYYRTVLSIIHALKTPNASVDLEFNSTSATPFCFNRLLNSAYYSDCDYWVMMHSDLAPKESNWLEGMILDMRIHDLAVLSAVAAIKSEDGLTSTGVNTREAFPRRLTTYEINTGPDVLTNEICKRIYGHSLLINTGCMVWDMKKMREHIPSLPFEFHDRWGSILTDQGEKMVPEFIPEDWLMSTRLDELGVKFGSTKRITTYHKGQKEYYSGDTWGNIIDQQHLQFEAMKPKD